MLPNWFAHKRCNGSTCPQTWICCWLYFSDLLHLYKLHDSDKFLLVYRSLNVFKVDVRNQQAFPEVKGRKWEQWIAKYQKGFISLNNGSSFFVTVTQIVSCVIIGGGFIRWWCETHVQAHVGPTSSYANRDAFSLQRALLPFTLLVLGFLKESDSRMQLQV